MERTRNRSAPPPRGGVKSQDESFYFAYTWLRHLLTFCCVTGLLRVMHSTVPESLLEVLGPLDFWRSTFFLLC